MATKAAKREETEIERLILWRYEHLVEELGFPPQDAVTLVEVPDVVHEARKLINGGCSVPLALKILKAA